MRKPGIKLCVTPIARALRSTFHRRRAVKSQGAPLGATFGREALGAPKAGWWLGTVSGRPCRLTREAVRIRNS